MDVCVYKKLSNENWSIIIIIIIIICNRAFHSGDVLQWRILKYKVQTEIAVRKKKYYRTRVQHLRKTIVESGG